MCASCSWRGVTVSSKRHNVCFLISELHCPYTGALKLVRIASLVLCPLIMFPIMLTGVCKVVSQNSCPLLSTHVKHDHLFWGPPTTSHSGVQQCFSNVSEELNIWHVAHIESWQCNFRVCYSRAGTDLWRAWGRVDYLIVTQSEGKRGFLLK